MEQNKQYFRCLMLFYFCKGKNATQIRKIICAVYGEDTVSERVKIGLRNFVPVIQLVKIVSAQIDLW